MAVSYWAAGPPLGLFFAGFFIATWFVPAAALMDRDWKISAAISESVIFPIMLIWLSAIFRTSDTFLQWLQLSITLHAYGLSLFALARLIVLASLWQGRPAHANGVEEREDINFKSAISSNQNAASTGETPMPQGSDTVHCYTAAYSICVILGTAWLSWPIWLSQGLSHLGPTFTRFLVAIHPPLTANGVLISETPWTERTLAYQLTNLNQDIPIRLPENAFLCILFHLAVAAFFLVAMKLVWRLQCQKAPNPIA
jgi:hypothetical protein